MNQSDFVMSNDRRILSRLLPQLVGVAPEKAIKLVHFIAVMNGLWREYAVPCFFCSSICRPWTTLSATSAWTAMDRLSCGRKSCPALLPVRHKSFSPIPWKSSRSVCKWPARWPAVSEFAPALSSRSWASRGSTRAPGRASSAISPFRQSTSPRTLTPK